MNEARPLRHLRGSCGWDFQAIMPGVTQPYDVLGYEL